MELDNPTPIDSQVVACGPLTDADRDLVAAATEVVDRCSDGANHTVAAAVRDASGRIHTGVNVFHFTGGPCAELVVLGVARVAGAGELESIVAVGDEDRGVLSPCGRCRQVLADLHGGLRVILPTGGALAAVSAVDLLPFRYEQTYERRLR